MSDQPTHIHEPAKDDAPFAICKVKDHQGYLQTSHWSQVRVKSRAIYGNRCVFCQAEDQISFHHTFYPSKMFDIKAHQVIPLCQKCHDLYHANAKNGGIHSQRNGFNPNGVNIQSVIKSIFRTLITVYNIAANECAAIHQRERKCLKDFWVKESAIVEKTGECKGKKKKNRRPFRRYAWKPYNPLDHNQYTC